MAIAKITPELAQKLHPLTPCAIHLYIWLLNQVEAGEEQEFFFEEFVNSHSYGMKSLRRAFEALVTANLIEIRRRYTGTIFKIIAHDSSTRNFRKFAKKV